MNEINVNKNEHEHEHTESDLNSLSVFVSVYDKTIKIYCISNMIETYAQ